METNEVSAETSVDQSVRLARPVRPVAVILVLVVILLVGLVGGWFWLRHSIDENTKQDERCFEQANGSVVCAG